MRVELKRDPGDILWIPVVVNGIATRAVLDTGANLSFIGKRAATELGLKAHPELVAYKNGDHVVYPATIDVPCDDGMTARINFGSLIEETVKDEVFLLGMNLFPKFNMFWCGETETASIDFLPLSARQIELTRAVRDKDQRIVGQFTEWVSPEKLAELTVS